jgi:hypothetical protein|tara:strand:- start:431 stop:751 length:321 start_codon:yes stop_codon:yes gene_type:complete
MNEYTKKLKNLTKQLGIAKLKCSVETNHSGEWLGATSEGLYLSEEEINIYENKINIIYSEIINRYKKMDTTTIYVVPRINKTTYIYDNKILVRFALGCHHFYPTLR